ncbi:MAG TPA: NAD(P)-dependent oxidoreductase [Candidatus Limnocylindrales bacterium]|nr:NAD(P)-dependent oxidoreductase [Candidatus Limnocylindrales bacterium]
MILITGGLGFIGLHTARRFLDVGEQVVLTQFRVRREPDFIKAELGKRAFIETLDVTSAHDVIEIVRKYKITGIVHLAVPGLGALSAAEDYRMNVMGFLNVVEAARLFDVRRVSVASSVAVYAGLAEGPFREDALVPVHSGNPTETFKKALEILGLHYASRTNLEIVALRIGTPFGPLYHSLAAPTSRIIHAAAKGLPADFTGARGGAPHQDDDTGAFYVKDCARAIQLLQLAEKLTHRIFNISAERPMKYREFVEAVKKVVPSAKIDLPPGHGPRNRPNAYMDISRLNQEVGYQPEYSLERGVGEYIDWLKNHAE